MGGGGDEEIIVIMKLRFMVSHFIYLPEVYEGQGGFLLSKLCINLRLELWICCSRGRRGAASSLYSEFVLTTTACCNEINFLTFYISLIP
jgi:hypothetical protein